MGETRLAARCCGAKRKILADHSNYYSGRTLAGLAYGLALGSILANTSLDADFQDWYQEDVRSTGTDGVSQVFETLGDGRIFLGAFACLAVASAPLDHWPVGSVTSDFSCRTTRAYLVGAPPMLLMQFVLGASRPGETAAGSHWRPFDDTNAVSGHAFVGAVPLMTAARMSDNLVLRSGLYACSALPAWSRVNDDRHYLSQAILGWWMAYLACEAIDQTQAGVAGLTLMPTASTEMVGFGGIYEY